MVDRKLLVFIVLFLLVLIVSFVYQPEAVLEQVDSARFSRLRAGAIKDHIKKVAEHCKRGKGYCIIGQEVGHE